MPIIARANVGTTWTLMPRYIKISNRTNPKNPKGLENVQVFSVRERKNKKHDMLPIRHIYIYLQHEYG